MVAAPSLGLQGIEIIVGFEDQPPSSMLCVAS
jgi:hypothetical protein